MPVPLISASRRDCGNFRRGDGHGLVGNAAIEMMLFLGRAVDIIVRCVAPCFFSNLTGTRNVMARETAEAGADG